MRDVLWQLNVPGHLEHFGWVSRKIVRLLGRRKALQKAFAEYGDSRHLPDFTFLDRLQSWCEFYSAHRTAIEAPMGSLFATGPPSSTNSKDKNPLMNRGMSRHGYYGALLCISEDASVQAVWEKLALRFLLSHQVRMCYWSRKSYEEYSGTVESPDLPKKVYMPAKQLRYLSQQKYASLWFFLFLGFETIIVLIVKPAPAARSANTYPASLL